MAGVPLWLALKRAFRAFVLVFPSELRFVASLLLFWPTVLLNRLYCWWLPARRRLWDRITPSVVLGAAPVAAADVAQLHSRERVRAVVNLCREWPATAHSELYSSLKVAHLHAPTIDYDIPRWDDVIASLMLMRSVEKAGGTTYVHCKGECGPPVRRGVCVWGGAQRRAADRARPSPAHVETLTAPPPPATHAPRPQRRAHCRC